MEPQKRARSLCFWMFCTAGWAIVKRIPTQNVNPVRLFEARITRMGLKRRTCPISHSSGATRFNQVIIASRGKLARNSFRCCTSQALRELTRFGARFCKSKEPLLIRTAALFYPARLVAEGLILIALHHSLLGQRGAHSRFPLLYLFSRL